MLSLTLPRPAHAVAQAPNSSNDRPGAAVAQQKAAPTADPQKLFEELNDLPIDPTQIYVLRNARLTRDRLRIFFNRGYVAFLKPVEGEVTGAVFTGDGEVLLIPPNPIDGRNLRRFTGSVILEEQFRSAYLRFTDPTAKELLSQAHRPDPDDPEQPTGLVQQWEPAVKGLDPIYSVRVLQDILGQRGLPFFQAQVDGLNLGAFGVEVDERMTESVRVDALRRAQEIAYDDIWCSFPSQGEEGRKQKTVTVDSYKIDTRIDPENNIEGHAVLNLASDSSADRVLIFELSRQLDVSEVKDGEGRKLEVLEGASGEGSAVATRGNDELVVVLPAPVPAGVKFRLEFSYHGRVIGDAGNGVLYVGARGSWYPNAGPLDRAQYDLTFQYPDRLTLVATGRLVDESSTGGWKHSHWISDGPLPVAGFNLGAYVSTQRELGKAAVTVFATREAEAALENRHAEAQPKTAVIGHQPGHLGLSVETIPTAALPLDPSALVAQVADSAADAVRFFETLFGPYPYPQLSISQVPGDFGQGWPGLVYLPTLFFLTSRQQNEMGLTRSSEYLVNQIVLVHEIAHQWWGNELGWKSYHDQWLSEGFASYAAALYIRSQKDRDGERKFRQLLQNYKQDLLAKNKDGDTVESGGPIWSGERLSDSLNPNGYDNIVYKKACWVLHMLRVLMTDPKTGSDEQFFKMLQDFVSEYKGKDPSTEDFIRLAERYMTPAMDLDHNHRLSWFFNDWVYGTGIPEYEIQAHTRRAGREGFITQGRIEQSGVSDDFEMLVPVAATFGKEGETTLGLVHVSSSGGEFRFVTPGKPTHITVDQDDLLAVVR